MRTYVTRSGATQYQPSMGEVREAIEEQSGFCLACGVQAYGVEPDARKYTCEDCGKAKVYGAEELVIMGLVYGAEDEGEDSDSD